MVGLANAEESSLVSSPCLWDWGSWATGNACDVNVPPCSGTCCTPSRFAGPGPLASRIAKLGWEAMGGNVGGFPAGRCKRRMLRGWIFLKKNSINNLCLRTVILSGGTSSLIVNH